MFEKEAEEKGNEYIPLKKQNVYARFQRKGYKDGFKQGAEFGYNKANEWHFVKDGDLPKEYDTVLVCTEFDQHKSCLICNYHYKKWWYANGKYDEDVIAWKEIVLPELKESE